MEIMEILSSRWLEVAVAVYLIGMRSEERRVGKESGQG